MRKKMKQQCVRVCVCACVLGYACACVCGFVCVCACVLVFVWARSIKCKTRLATAIRTDIARQRSYEKALTWRFLSLMFHFHKYENTSNVDMMFY